MSKEKKKPMPDHNERRRAVQDEVLVVLRKAKGAQKPSEVAAKMKWEDRRRPRSALTAVLDQLVNQRLARKSGGTYQAT